MRADLGDIIRRKINWFRESEVDVKLIKRYGNIDQLGISDTEDKNFDEFDIKIIPIIRGTTNNEMGERENITPIGDNPDTYLEFIRLLNDNKENIEIGNRVIYENDEYTIYHHLPVVLGNELILNQYRAKKVD